MFLSPLNKLSLEDSLRYALPNMLLKPLRVLSWKKECHLLMTRFSDVYC
jgi:hypothetical protein